MISLGISESARRYDESDLALATDLARRAALAVDNALLYRAAQTELAERRRVDEELRLSEERFRAVFEQSPLSTQILTRDGSTMRVNAAWEKLLTAKLEMIAGYNVFQDPQLEALGITPLLRRAANGEAVTIPAARYDPEQTLPEAGGIVHPAVWVRAFAYPIKDTTGAVHEIVLIHEDVSAQIAATDRVRASEERLRIALQGARMCVWDMNVATNASGRIAEGRPSRRVTGWGQDEDRRRSREAGFDHHLTKPTDARDLAAVVESVGRRTK